MFIKFHSKKTCYDNIYKQMEEYDPDVVISVHPTMNHIPELVTREIGKKRGKHLPFFTVVTDFGSGHGTWFQGNPNKIYIASDRIKSLAMKCGKGVNEENLVMTGLPIRDDFAIHAEKMGPRTSAEGKKYRNLIKSELGLNPDKKVVLVMGGGEGVGSLGEIAEKIYLELRAKGVDATVCVVCGRNEILKAEFGSKDWDAIFSKHEQKQNKWNGKKLMRLIIERKQATSENTIVKEGNVEVIGLGFVKNMADYMVAADALVSKAGPGTIAEAAAVGLPVMITRYVVQLVFSAPVIPIY